MTNWTTTPPTEPGWYWWREKPEHRWLPVLVEDGPFRNNAFQPGVGWCLKDKMRGEWWSTPIEEPRND